VCQRWSNMVGSTPTSSAILTRINNDNIWEKRCREVSS